MGTTKINLINGALLVLGKQPVQLGNETPIAKEINIVYEQTIKYAFANYTWHFAIETYELEKTGDSELIDGWAVWQKPPQAERIINVFYRNANNTIQYRLQGDGIHAPPLDGLKALIVVQQPESKYPPYFAEAIEARLAAELAPRWNKEMAQIIIGKSEALMNTAKSADWRNGGSVQDQFANNDLTSIRGRDQLGGAIHPSYYLDKQ